MEVFVSLLTRKIGQNKSRRDGELLDVKENCPIEITINIDLTLYFPIGQSLEKVKWP